MAPNQWMYFEYTSSSSFTVKSTHLEGSFEVYLMKDTLPDKTNYLVKDQSLFENRMEVGACANSLYKDGTGTWFIGVRNTGETHATITTEIAPGTYTLSLEACFN